jgi:hypothetical protein
MSIKFDPALSPPTFIFSTLAAAKTLPDSDWAIGCVIYFNSINAAVVGQPQYLYSTGPFQTAGSFNLVYEPASAANSERNVHLFLGASNSPVCISPTSPVSGDSWLFVFQRVSGNLTVKQCRVLASAPVDGSAVLTGQTVALTGTLVGTGNLTIGARSDQATNRVFGQSAARIFRLDGTGLTDFEIAKLAYGMELSDIGKTPAQYIRMNDVSDLSDRGTQANSFSATPSTMVTGTSPGFGYVASGTPVAPAISGLPTFAGAAVGSVSTVSPASTTGTPSPANTFQWKIDGAAISGATGTTYTPISSDAGKTLTVTQTANSTSGTATATSTGSVVSATVAYGIDAAQLVAERIYQRISGAATIAVSGTWVGSSAPASVEYQLFAPNGTDVQKTWASIGATIAAGGTWVASPSIPQPTNGKKYLIQYRSKDLGGTVLATSAIKSNRFGVGDIHGFIGSSSAEKAFYTDSGTGFTLDPDVTSRYDGTWYTITAGCAIQIASYLAVQAGVPIAFLDYGIGGSVITDWTNTSYSQWTAFASGVSDVGGKISGCLITIGSNDAAYGSVTSRASHLANWRTMIANVRALTSQSAMPICAIGFNRRTNTTVSQSVFDLCSDYVRMAENDIGDDANVCTVQTMDFLLSSDGIHLASVDTGFPAWGRRISYQYGSFIAGTYLRGPKITQISVTGNVATVSIANRGSTDFTPTSGITGFTAFDTGGVAVTINSAVRTNATTITLTCASAPAKIQYLEGSAPAVGTPVFGNTASPLPMTVETDRAIVAALATAANFTVVDSTGAAVTGVTGLDYAFYDNYRVSAGAAPVKYGTNLAITGGTATINITGVTTLAPGGIGRVIWSDAAGTKIGSGLVTVS